MKLTIKEGRAKLRTAAISNGPELAKAIEAAIRKHFPKSMVVVKFAPNRFKPTEGSISLAFAVAGSTDEVPNRIINNDISYTQAFIYGMDSEGNFQGKLAFEPTQGGKIVARPDWIKVGLRKKTAPKPELIVKHIGTYFGKLLKMIKDNADKIGDQHKSLLKSIDLS